jgi:hypothetical protein
MRISREGQKSDQHSLQGAAKPHLAGEGEKSNEQDNRAGGKRDGHAGKPHDVNVTFA